MELYKVPLVSSSGLYDQILEIEIPIEKVVREFMWLKSEAGFISWV